jgi:hypothetical protein
MWRGEADVGGRLRGFRNETERMSSPVCRAQIPSFVRCLNFVAEMEGLTVSHGAHFIRQMHNTRSERGFIPQCGERNYLDPCRKLCLPRYPEQEVMANAELNASKDAINCSPTPWRLEMNIVRQQSPDRFPQIC